MYYQTQMGMQAAPALPFPPNQVMWPWINISLQNPPYLPTTVRPVDPGMLQLVPFVAAICAFETQKAAQEQPGNPLRVFMFNIVGQNNFANAEFEALVAATMDYLWLGLMAGRFPNMPIEQAAQLASMQMIEMIRSAYIAKFPALEQFCDPQLLQNARGLLQAFQQSASEINAAKQRAGVMASGTMPVSVGYGGMGMNYGNPGIHRAYGGGGSNWQASLNVASTTVQPGSGSMFNNVNRPAPTTGSAAGVSTSRYDQENPLRQPFQARAATPQPAQEEQTVQVPVQPEPAAEPLIPMKDVKWRPSENFPYLPAYNPDRHVVFLKMLADGTFEPVIKNKEEVMDYERHAVATFGPKPRNLDLSKTPETLERIEQGIAQINRQEPPEVVEGDKEVVLPFTQMIRADTGAEGEDNVLREVSSEAVWLVAGLARLVTHVNGQVPDIYRVHAKLYEPIVGQTNETPQLRNMAACETFIELREKLNASVNRISAGLWTAVNNRMTRAVNRAIKQNLSLPGLAMTHYADDIEDMLALIKNRYGETVSEALLKRQADVIRRTLGVFSDEEAEQETSQFLPSEDLHSERCPKITYVASNVSFTFLNCRSHELQLELAPKTSAAVIRSYTPMVHELLRGIFESTTTKVFETEHGEFDTHLIRTTDGRVLEAQRGFLNEDYYVLTLID